MASIAEEQAGVDAQLRALSSPTGEVAILRAELERCVGVLTTFATAGKAAGDGVMSAFALATLNERIRAARAVLDAVVAPA